MNPAAILAQLRALGPLRLGAMAAVGAGVLGLVLWFALRAGQPPMAVLYAEMDPRDAGSVVTSLERQRVPYRLGGGGTTVLVPEEQVARLRLALAREGLPAGGSVGWEIFDRGESLTTTPFQQDVNRVRAMEGELARTIRGLAGVRAARVHLVLPRREAFSRQTADAQASVVLTMQGSQRLDREGVQAVLHLVATAVPGLRPSAVSIVDSRGELLARGGQALAGPAAAQTGEEMRRTEALRIARAVEEMLERTLGPGRVRAEATVEMDFDRVQTTEERYDPENQVPRSVQTSQEQSRSSEPQNVSVGNQLPGAEPNNGGPGNQESKSEETTNYEIGRTVRNTTRDHPTVRRLSLAVLVDGVWEGTPPAFQERSAEELARLAALVRSAIGADERRGDRVEVVSMRFTAPDGTPAPVEGLAAWGIGPSAVMRLAESGIFALVALLALLLVARPLARRLTVMPTPSDAALAGGAAGATAIGAADAAAALAGPASLAALPGTTGEDEMISPNHVQGQLRAASVARVVELMEQHPEQGLAVIRGWLTPQEAS